MIMVTICGVNHDCSDLVLDVTEVCCCELDGYYCYIWKQHQ